MINNLGISSRLITISFLVLLFLISCQETENNETFVLDETTFVRVLADVHLAEAALQNLSVADKDSVGSIYYDQIYTIHGIDETELSSCLEVLKTNPIIAKRIYKIVQDTIDARHKQVTKLLK